MDSHELRAIGKAARARRETAGPAGTLGVPMTVNNRGGRTKYTIAYP
jgi:hypothetical protein